MKKTIQVHNTVDGWCHFVAQREFDSDAFSAEEFQAWVKESAAIVPEDERGTFEICDEGADCFYVMAQRDDGTMVMGPRSKFDFG